jgi:hypothetical protein
MVHQTAIETAARAAGFKSLPHLSHQVPDSLHPRLLQSFPWFGFWQVQSALFIVLLGVDLFTVIADCNSLREPHSFANAFLWSEGDH